MAGTRKLSRAAIGAEIESRALTMLLDAGLQLLTRNFRSRYGEIDLIMRERETIVFVEVRHRSHAGYGGAAESIDSRKRKRLLLTAQWYLRTQGLGERFACRFDIVTSDGGSVEDSDLHWQQAAFDAG